MSNKIYRIAIVGASSLVGKELSDVLSESALGASSFTLLDEEQMAGSVAAAGDEISFIQKIDSSSFEGKDLVFFAGDAEVAAKYWKSAVSASAIRSVSRARSGLVIMPGPSARAASTRARLVMDLEPGSRTPARTGPAATGACQYWAGPLSATRVPFML